MATRPPIIFYPFETPTVRFLFLSEGYSNRLEFLQHVDGIVQNLLTIDPFEQMKSKIAVWAHFVPSTDSPVTNVEQNTAFGFFVSPEGKLTTRKPHLLVHAITDIEVSVPHLPDPLGFVDGSEVWLNRLVPQESILCVLGKNANPSSSTVLEWSQEMLEPSGSMDALRGLSPCIFLSSWALTPGTSVQYANPSSAVALTLAKQIGLLLGLADECELPGPECAKYSEADPFDPTAIREPPWPNVTAHASLADASGQLQLPRLKWSEFIPAKRRTGFAECPHPIVGQGASDVQIQTLYDNAAQLGETAVLLLRHPGLTEPSRETANVERYVDRPGKALWLEKQVNLFEGAAGYRQGIYRPSCECLMRYEGYDASTGNKVTRKEVPFCTVCREHLRRELVGFGEFKLDGIKIKPCVAECRKRLDSKVGEAMVRYINAHTPTNGIMVRPSGEIMACVEATARRFEGLFNDALQWKECRRVSCGDWDPRELKFPFRLGNRTSSEDSRRAWCIWNTKLNPDKAGGGGIGSAADPYALSRWNSQEHAGLGAPGAIVYLGFGCLVNQRERGNRMVIRDAELGGSVSIEYDDVVPLTIDDFENIQPGAILQVWHGDGANSTERLSNARTTFRNIVAYVGQSRLHRQAGLKPTDPPIALGHSLYYVGMENGEPMIADQLRPRHSLTVDWRSYPFWIAAQWFDATGITLI